jgi:hypothetical protein
MPTRNRRHPQSPDSAPARGRLMLTKAVRSEIFCDAVSGWWIRRNVAPTKRIKLGHSTVGWYEQDVREWVDERRAS